MINSDTGATTVFILLITTTTTFFAACCCYGSIFIIFIVAVLASNMLSLLVLVLSVLAGAVWLFSWQKKRVKTAWKTGSTLGGGVFFLGGGLGVIDGVMKKYIMRDDVKYLIIQQVLWPLPLPFQVTYLDKNPARV